MPKMSMRKLFATAEKAQAARDAEKAAKAEKDGWNDVLVADMGTRGVKAIVNATGRKLTMVSQTETLYPWDAFAAHPKISAATLRRIQRREIDPALLAAEVIAGNISAKIVADLQQERVKASYFMLSGGTAGE